MTKKVMEYAAKSCPSCSTNEQLKVKKSVLPKLCIGHIAMIIAFVYIAVTQILA